LKSKFRYYTCKDICDVNSFVLDTLEYDGCGVGKPDGSGDESSDQDGSPPSRSGSPLAPGTTDCDETWW
jgi:hypothetical protein